MCVHVCVGVQVLEHSKNKDDLIEKLAMANARLAESNKTAYQEGNKDGQAGVTQVGSTGLHTPCG